MEITRSRFQVSSCVLALPPIYFTCCLISTLGSSMLFSAAIFVLLLHSCQMLAPPAAPPWLFAHLALAALLLRAYRGLRGRPRQEPHISSIHTLLADFRVSHYPASADEFAKRFKKIKATSSSSHIANKPS